MSAFDLFREVGRRGRGGGSPKVDIVYFFTVIHTKASLNVFVNVIVIVITLINVSKVTSV